MSRRLNLGLLGLIATASGVYLLVYLVRWEWHRAIIAGLFFIAAEVALAAGVIMARLRGIERRLEQLAPGGTGSSPPAEIVTRLRETAPAAHAPFAWLKSDQEMNVFLPVLLGAGLLASAAAWVVESVARATARPVMERDLARRLVPAAWPAGGLLGAGTGTNVGAPGGRVRGAVAKVAVVGVLGSALWGYDALADAIQTRPEAAEDGVSTQIDLRLYGRRMTADPVRVAGDLWGSCKLSLSRTLPDPVVTALTGTRVRLVVAADLGRFASNRIRGCLEDATLDHLQAGVVSVTRLP